jgi:hypothetical protein
MGGMEDMTGHGFFMARRVVSTAASRYRQPGTGHHREQLRNAVDWKPLDCAGPIIGQASHKERICMRMPFSHALIVLDGELPTFARFTFIYLVERARRLLARCDIEKSQEKLDNLDWIPLILDPDRFMPDASESLREIEPHERDATQPSLVYQHMQDFDQGDLSGFQWSEYFALMALNCVSQVWLYEGLFDDVGYKESKHSRSLQNTLAHFTAEAAEAVTLGEQLLERESVNAESGVGKASVCDPAALKKRHEKIAKLKREFFIHFDPDDYRGQAAAVRKYLGELANEDHKLLVPTKAERTFLGVIRAHLSSTSEVTGKQSAASDTSGAEPGDVG